MDEVSELSERLSVASTTSSFSSTSSSWAANSDLEHEDDERTGGGRQGQQDAFPSLEGVGQQRDLEHTEYAVLPPRRESEQSVDREEEEERDEIDLLFEEAPPEGVVVEAGKILTLECCVKGQRPIGSKEKKSFIIDANTTFSFPFFFLLFSSPLYTEVSWFRRSQPLEVDGDRSEAASLGGGRHRLALFGLTEDDSGVFSCAAANAHGQRWRNFSIIVNRRSMYLKKIIKW